MIDKSRLIFEFSLLAVLGWICVCMLQMGLRVTGFLSLISIPIMTLLIVAFFLELWKGKARWFIGVMFCLYILFECAYGLMQLLGIAESSSGAMNGHFHDSQNYGAMIALGYVLSTAILRRYHATGAFRTLFVILKFLFVVFMIFSGSQAAWVAAILAVILIICKETDTLRLIKFYKKGIVVVSIATVIAILALCYIFPKPITDQFHLQMLEAKIMLEHPMYGVGAGNEMQFIKQAQIEYNIAHGLFPDANMPAKISNEFLRVGMTSGIIGFFLMIAACALGVYSLWKKKSLLLYPFIMIVIYALFSNPLAEVQICLAIAYCLADATTIVSQDKRRAILVAFITVAMGICMYPYAKDAITRFARHGLELKTEHHGEIVQDDVLPLDYELLDF